MEIAWGSLLFFWLLCGVIGAVIGKDKGTPIEAFFIAFFLGPLGVLLVLAGPGNQVQCQFCRKRIAPDASICPYCRSSDPISASRLAKRNNTEATLVNIHPSVMHPRFKLKTSGWVLRFHQNNETGYVLEESKSIPSFKQLRTIDRAYEELEKARFVERTGKQLPIYENGPERPVRRITATGKKVVMLGDWEYVVQ